MVYAALRTDLISSQEIPPFAFLCDGKDQRTYCRNISVKRDWRGEAGAWRGTERDTIILPRFVFERRLSE
jgi:hypothetical protein